MHTKSVFVPTLLKLTSSDTIFLLRNSLIPFVTSSPVNSSISPALQCKLSLLSCAVSIASNSSLHNSAMNCEITEFGIFRRQETNYFSMPSGTLMGCCKNLHFVMSQSSSEVKSAKSKTVFTRLIRPGFIFKKSFICSLYPANIIMGFSMFGIRLLFMLTISVSTASFPKSCCMPRPQTRHPPLLS